MPDLLIVTSDHKLQTAAEDLARAKNFRVKSALDAAGALDWLKNWIFDVACVDPAIPVSEQEQIADVLWRENPLAPFIVLDLAAKNTHRVEQKLFGADVMHGVAGLEAFGKVLDDIGPRSVMQLDKFPVMVVEDLDSPRDIICAFIESMGFTRVIGHRSVKDALAQLIADPACCSCIVTDVRMPEFTGEYLIDQVRKHAKLQHLPIVVLTAYGSSDTLLACLRAGASGFLVKPPKRNDLARELGRAYRIFARTVSPRLASPDEIEQLRAALERRGFS